MLFNSVEYLIFYSAIFTISWLLIGMPRLRIWIILLASYYFYTSNNLWMIFLLILCTTVDYFAAIWIEDCADDRKRKLYLALSMSSNLAVLCFFKYFNFFQDTIVQIARAAGVELGWTSLNIFLPIGISFYTFESMSYTIDVYRRHMPAERSWARLSFFVAFFPHLIAGPIVRADYFLPQVQKKPTLSLQDVEESLYLIFTGLFKKIVLANFLALLVDRVFDFPDRVAWLEAWVGIYAFSFQIYFDFSGYTDIAIGCSRLMGYKLQINFLRPYMASSFSDFWKRWHISLSTWLRDYLYVPLGGNRMKTRWGVYRNLMITMFLGGLWHGAAWHFVLWGVLHGMFLIAERMLNGDRPSSSPRNFVLLKRVFIFQCITVTWILFRSKDTSHLAELFKSLMDFNSHPNWNFGILVSLVIIVGGWLAQLIGEKYISAKNFLRLPFIVKGLVYSVLTAAILIFGSEAAKPFIYFQF